MISHVSTFLRTELTPVPSFLERILGKYYNNALCNGATWMFLLWSLVHAAFNNCLQALLRRMGYREYVRVRLVRVLWYLGFYTVACAYASATMWRSGISLSSFNLRGDVAPGSLVMGFMLLTTFFLHSAFWERLNNNGCGVYFSLFVLFLSTYLMQLPWGYLRLTVFISGPQILMELTRLASFGLKFTDYVNARIVIAGVLLSLSILTYVITYLILIPVMVGYLLDFSSSEAFLLFLLLTWLIFDMLDSALLKLIFHYRDHTLSSENVKSRSMCPGNFFECCLFPPRSDATFNYRQFKRDVKERRERRLLGPIRLNLPIFRASVMSKTPSDEENSNKQKLEDAT